MCGLNGKRSLKQNSMLVVDSLVCDSIISVSSQTPLRNAIDLMASDLQENEREDAQRSPYDPTSSLSNYIFVVEGSGDEGVNKSRLVGIFSRFDIPRVIHTQVNLSITPIEQFMRPPSVALQPDFEVEKAFELMQATGWLVLPIIGSDSEFLGAVTIEIIAQQLYQKLCHSQVQLQAEAGKDKQLEEIHSKNEELTKANKQLQRAICDRIATEAQLLQTTSELQEIFHAFPDIYFRIANDGKILSYHARELSELYVSPDQFTHHKFQDIFPTDIAIQFQSAICQLNTGSPSVTVEYKLHVPKGEQWFEARMFLSLHNQIIAIIRNITEQKQAQEDLQSSHQDLETRVEKRTQELKNTNERLLQEIIERQRIEETLRYRVKFEQIISTLSTHFINLTTEQLDRGIEHALQVISEFAQVDRSYVFLFAERSWELEAKYEWCREELQGMEPCNTTMEAQMIRLVRQKFQISEIIYIPLVADLTVEETLYKQLLIEQKIQSQIILPIVCGGQKIGYLGFDTILMVKTWSDDSITLLKMVAEMFAHTFERKRIEQILNISQERYTRAINAGKVGIWEWNIDTNEIYLDPNLKTMLGCENGHEKGNVDNDFHEWLGYIHSDDIAAYKVAANAYLEGLTSKFEVEHRMYTKNREVIWFLARGTVVRDRHGKPKFMAGSNTDITASKQAELKLKASLQEKEVLLKEIHHRVKNNLQVISSLLRLQAAYIKDEPTLEIFRDSQNRVRAMAMIHENLYHSNDLASINFADYTRNLMQNLTRCYGINKNITIHQNVDGILLRIDTAIPCGLIINELTSNAIKHAFINRDEGNIYIDFLDLGQGKYSLSVSDDGVGFNETIEEKSRKSLGLQLVWSLVEQLEGSIISNTKCGTSFTVKFIQLC